VQSLEDLNQVECSGSVSLPVGARVRRGDLLSDNAEDVAPHAGQILSIEQEIKYSKRVGPAIVTLRRGTVYLVTDQGGIRVKTGDTVEKGHQLGYEEIRVPKTSDIVQGLPRIEKLFEARGGVLQKRLLDLWDASRKQGKTQLQAAIIARDQLRQEVVAEVQGAYLDQGVFINPRHIEVIVRRMTQKCEILSSSGGSVLPPGALVDYLEIEALQSVCPGAEIGVRPLIRGVTKVGLDSHMLVAMGFREVDNILAKTLYGGTPVHPVMGIKENLMIGKRINVGTNHSPDQGLWEAAGKDATSTDFDLSSIPELDLRLDDLNF